MQRPQLITRNAQFPGNVYRWLNDVMTKYSSSNFKNKTEDKYYPLNTLHWNLADIKQHTQKRFNNRIILITSIIAFCNENSYYESSLPSNIEILVVTIVWLENKN